MQCSVTVQPFVVLLVSKHTVTRMQGRDLSIGTVLPFNRTLSSVVSGLLTRNNTLRRHFYVMGLINPYPTAFPYGNGMVLHFYQQQESSTTKTVHKVINKGLKAYV